MNVKPLFAPLFAAIALLAAGACSQTRNGNAAGADSAPGTPPPAPSVSDSTPSTQPPAPGLTLALAGDIMMGTTYPDSIHGSHLPADGGSQLFSDVAGLLRGADIAAANLEGTLLDSCGIVKKCADPKVCYAFRTPTKYVDNLSAAGIDFVSIANNHINDFGKEGIQSTIKTLHDAGIAYAGLSGRCETVTLLRDGRRIGFAAFGHSGGTPSIMDYARVRRTVSGLKKDCDIVVVSFHGGGEGAGFEHVPHAPEEAFGDKRGDVEKFAHTAVDAGADIVYGHGPHVLRAAELYRDRLILYSLGNFCTPYRVSLKESAGEAPVVTASLAADGRFQSGRIHSFIQQPGRGPRLDSGNRAARRIRTLTRQDFPSTPLHISDDGTLTPGK